MPPPPVPALGGRCAGCAEQSPHLSGGRDQEITRSRETRLRKALRRAGTAGLSLGT